MTPLLSYYFCDIFLLVLLSKGEFKHAFSFLKYELVNFYIFSLLIYLFKVTIESMIILSIFVENIYYLNIFLIKKKQ